jgi:hypothetical protein
MTSNKWKDEIVEETRKAREAYTAKFNYNLNAIYQDLKDKEKKSSQIVVSLKPKKSDANLDEPNGENI